MALYEYFCPTCKIRFEKRRPMAEANDHASCSQGHRAERTVSAFAFPRGGSVAVEDAPGASGGCACGGSCGCGR